VTALALNCSLKPADSESSTDKLIGELLAALTTHDVTSAGTIRVGEHNVLPGVTSDEGDGDAWPANVSRSSTPTSWYSAHRSGWVTPPVMHNVYWNGSTRSSAKPTPQAECSR
jgi:hypothetical protein